MMPVEAAILTGYRRCQKINSDIERIENQIGSMCYWLRNEVGAWRRLMLDAGVNKADLPKTPYLKPEHLEAYQAKQASKKAAKASGSR